jgi:hypothetical protein
MYILTGFVTVSICCIAASAAAMELMKRTMAFKMKRFIFQCIAEFSKSN